MKNNLQTQPKTPAEFFGKAKMTEKPSQEFSQLLKERVLNEYINYNSKKEMPENNKSRFSMKWGLPFAGLLTIVVAVLGFVAYDYFNSESRENDDRTPRKPMMLGEVNFIEGAVEYKLDDSGWYDAKPEMVIAENQTYRVIGEGRLIINLDDGSAIRLNDNSSVSLESLNPKDIVLRNESGEVFVRVAKAERDFSVKVDDVTFKSLGTSYNTFNRETSKGVQVFESSVAVIKADGTELTVEAGKELYIKSEVAEKVEQPIKIAKQEVEHNEFLNWNREKEQASEEYKDSVGFLDGAAFGEIKVELYKKETGFVIKFAKNGEVAPNGFKLVVAKHNNPTYGVDEAIFMQVESAGEYFYAAQDGQTYFVRVCEYSGYDCVNYSNVASVVASTKPEPKPITPVPTPSGNVVITSISGMPGAFKAIWSFGGEPANGFKIVYSKTDSTPTYGEDSYNYISDTGTRQAVTGGLEAGTYYVRVCRYVSGGCDFYSATKTVVVTAKEY